MGHNVYINDDILLGVFTSTINNPIWFVNLPVSHFDFIKENIVELK